MGQKKEYSEEAIREIEEALELTKNKVEIKRILVMKAKAELGLSNEAIGRLLNYSEFTVRDIVTTYNREGLPGLKLQQLRGGRRRENMSISEEKKLLKEFSETANSGKIATLTKIKELYEKKVGKKVNLSTISRLLRRHGWRKILPRQYHPKKDIDVQNAFKKTSNQSLLNTKKHWVNGL